MDQVHRIYTEDIYREEILKIVSAKFENFTIHTTLGYHHGQLERSIVIEIIEGTDRDVEAVARTIRAVNGQRAVLVMALTGNAKNIV